ncbi:hypothetical protein C7974DRAFT_306701, partial [Boeremia exigua]|uniref:uncharacterized protein n=1 Tax=Boeremia exigua TaxID=749465 RepID=UPI001E8E4F52
MRFLDRNLTTPDYFQPWSKGKLVIKIQYFFWNPGSMLQKSVVGLLRSMLYQLLAQQPNLVPNIVPMSMYMSSTPAADFQSVDWTQTQLQTTLYNCLVSSRDSIMAFILLDGLDELAGSDEIRVKLVDFLFKLAELGYVKLCISSRPWNIFHDSFQGCPRLKLEDLTRNDISLFVRAQLSGHARFQHVIRSQNESMDDIVNEITTKARGVFLWVHLVMRELSKGLRDGDGMRELRRRLEKIPSDLNDYFKRLMNTIEPDQQHDASVLLQIAL